MLSHHGQECFAKHGLTLPSDVLVTQLFSAKVIDLKYDCREPTAAFTSTWTEFAIDVIPDSNPDLRPSQTIALPTGVNPRNFVRIRMGSRKVSRVTVAGQTLTDQTMALEFLYKRKPE